MASEVRPLSQAEIGQLQNRGCSSSDWTSVRVAQNFNLERVKAVRFSGNVEIGVLEKTVVSYGGLAKPSSINGATIHNCKIGDNAYINNVSDCIANYTIEDDVVIDNVDLVAVEGESAFVNGTEVSVLNEAGGREIHYVTYGQLHLNRTSLQKGIDKYLGDCLVERLRNNPVESLKQLRAVLAADTDLGQGKWLGLFGLLVPEQALEEILKAIEEGALNTIEQLAQRLQTVHEQYGAYEWAWVVKNLERVLAKGVDEVTGDYIAGLITRWKQSLEALNGLILEDAQKEFTDSSMIGYGLDGDREVREADFDMVRGGYDKNSFVRGLENDTAEKAKIADDLIAKLAKCG